MFDEHAKSRAAIVFRRGVLVDWRPSTRRH
jgi:hypothetical protein